MKKVMLYTLSTCPWCRKAKQFFTTNGIPFEYIDYDLASPEDQEKMEKVMLENGGAVSFPWVIIGNTVVVGWDPERYAELLDLQRV